MTKEFDLFLKDFGLSTFADDILGSTVLKEPTSMTHHHHTNNKPIKKNNIHHSIKKKNNHKMIMDHLEEDEEDDSEEEDDDDIPLSKCILSQPPSFPLKASIQTNYLTLNQLSINDQDEDDEDLVPIAVLQDPKVKSQLTFQSAAEKYKKSILDRDPQLKTNHYHPNDRRHSFDPNHHSNSTSHSISSRYNHPSSSSTSTVMRSVSAGQKHRYHHSSKQFHSSHHQVMVNEDDDSDDDVPLFQTCLVSTSMNVKSPNVKV